MERRAIRERAADDCGTTHILDTVVSTLEMVRAEFQPENQHWV
jgi:hypothetical protein